MKFITCIVLSVFWLTVAIVADKPDAFTWATVWSAAALVTYKDRK